MAIAAGNLQGAVASNIYASNTRESGYRLGHTVILAYTLLGVVMSIIYLAYLYRENCLRDEGKRDEFISGQTTPPVQPQNGCYPSVAAAESEKGDLWSEFRYAL